MFIRNNTVVNSLNGCMFIEHPHFVCIRSWIQLIVDPTIDPNNSTVDYLKLRTEKNNYFPSCSKI